MARDKRKEERDAREILRLPYSIRKMNYPTQNAKWNWYHDRRGTSGSGYETRQKAITAAVHDYYHGG